MDSSAFYYISKRSFALISRAIVGVGVLIGASSVANAQDPIQLTVGVKDTGAWGNNYPFSNGPDVQEQTFRFEYTANAGGLLLTFSGFDLEKSNVEDAELSINIDGSRTTILAPSTRNGKTRTIRVAIPDSAFAGGTVHTIQVFNNEGANETWGMRNVWLRPLRGESLTATFDQTLSRQVGFRYGSDAHPEIIPVTVNVPSSQNIKVEVTGYDINKYGEGQIYLNGSLVGYLRSGGRKSLATKTTLRIPASNVNSGNNFFEFRQRKAGNRWGIARFRVSPESRELIANCARTDSDGDSSNQVYVSPGADLNDVVNSSPVGTEFLITKGNYYLDGPIVPRTGDKFICEQGAKLRGSVALRSASAVPAGNGRWRIPGAPAASEGNGFMKTGREINSIRNDLFVDGKLYLRVNSLNKVNDTDRRLDGTTVYYGTFYQSGRNVYVPMDPRRRVVEMSRIRHAFQSVDAGNDNNVTIEQCTVERFAPGDIQGAIEAARSSNWTVRNVKARYNHAGGLLVGQGTKAYCGNYSFNGQNGISGTFDPANNDDGDIVGFDSRSSNAVIQGTNTSFNNWAGYNEQWHSGGMKFVGTSGLNVTGNKIHHNYGVGFWIDFEVLNTTFTGNEVYENAARGVQVEVSRDATISNNIVKCNSTLGSYSLSRSWFWGSNILAKNSTDVDIRDNEVVVDRGQAIAVVDNLFTGYFIGTTDFRRAADVTVTDNTISFTDRAIPGGNAQFTHQMMGLESDGNATTGGQGALDCAAPQDFLDQGLVSQASINACNGVGGMNATAANNRIFNNTYNIPKSGYTYWRRSGTSVNRNNIPVSGTFNPADVNVDGSLGQSLCN